MCINIHVELTKLYCQFAIIKLFDNYSRQNPQGEGCTILHTCLFAVSLNPSIPLFAPFLSFHLLPLCFLIDFVLALNLLED